MKLYHVFYFFFFPLCFTHSWSQELTTSLYPDLSLELEKINIHEAEGSFSYSDSLETNTKFYESCHKDLEGYLEQFKVSEYFSNCSEGSVRTFFEDSDVIKLANEIGLGLLNKRIAREANPLFKNYFLTCQKKTAAFHLSLSQVAKKAYDISFKDRKKPTFIKGSIPSDFDVSKFYGHDEEACYQSGFKAVQLRAKSGDYVVFAITGTEGGSSKKFSDGTSREVFSRRKKTYFGLGKEKTIQISAEEADKSDWPNNNGFKPTGFNQFQTSCAKKLIKEAKELATNGTKVVFTGHSLGGSLAQGLSYQVQKGINEKSLPKTFVHSVGFMSAAGRELNPTIDKDIEADVRSTVYVTEGDIVPSISQSFTGGHMGEVRLIKRKKEIEERIKKRLEKADAHSLDFSRYEALETSKRILGGEIYKYNSKYNERTYQEIVEDKTLKESTSPDIEE